MKQIEGAMKTTDGWTLYTRAWLPDGPMKAGIYLLHGLGEHSGRYAAVAARLAGAGFAVYSFDGRGHGLSPGRRGYIARIAQYLQDIDQRRREVQAALGDQPLFLMGQSMGGGLAVRYALDQQAHFRGLVLTAPALQAGDDFSPLLMRIAGILSRLVPALPTQRLDLNLLSRTPDVVTAFANDPLTYKSGIPARTGAELLQMVDDIQAGMEKLTLPLLIMHGTADRVTNPAGSRRLYERAASADKRLELYEGLYHEIMNEPERDRVLTDLVNWLGVHV